MKVLVLNIEHLYTNLRGVDSTKTPPTSFLYIDTQKCTLLNIFARACARVMLIKL